MPDDSLVDPVTFIEILDDYDKLKSSYYTYREDIYSKFTKHIEDDDDDD